MLLNCSLIMCVLILSVVGIVVFDLFVLLSQIVGVQLSWGACGSVMIESVLYLGKSIIVGSDPILAISELIYSTILSALLQRYLFQSGPLFISPTH